jgi:hypothetical protein
MMPLLVPIVQSLFAQGLGTLANAVIAKGQDAIEQKLGVKLESADPMMLRQLEADHEEFLLNAVIEKREQELQFQAAQEKAVTERWSADMGSDSWLSKNIRPMVLIFLLSAYSVFSLLSAFGVNIAPSYVELLGQWGMLVMTAYFGGRTLEKIASIKESSK